MKKAITLVLSLVMMLALTACSNKSNDANEKSTKSDNVIDYPIASTSKYLEEAEPLPEIVFSTTGEENGLPGTVYFFDGTVVERDVCDDIDTEYVIIETEYGKILVTDMYSYLMNTLPAYGEIVKEDDCDYCLPQKDTKVHLIATYEGFSGRYDLPSFSLGANEFIVDSYREDNPNFKEKSEPIKPDFFFDEERHAKYKKLYTSLQFEELLNFLNTYIDEYRPSEEDSVFSVLPYVESAAEVIKNCTVTHDEFEDKYTAYYTGITELNNSTFVVPSICKGSIDLIFGFIRSDWLFFDEIMVKFSDELKSSYHPKSYDIQRDCSGWGVTEYWRNVIDREECQKYKDAENVIIRFKNSDTEEVLDHTLSPDEKNAVATMGVLQIANRNCSDFQFHWNGEHPNAFEK